jgi:hypothetical protein
LAGQKGKPANTDGFAHSGAGVQAVVCHGISLFS